MPPAEVAYEPGDDAPQEAPDPDGAPIPDDGTGAAPFGLSQRPPLPAWSALAGGEDRSDPAAVSGDHATIPVPAAPVDEPVALEPDQDVDGEPEAPDGEPVAEAAEILDPEPSVVTEPPEPDGPPEPGAETEPGGVERVPQRPFIHDSAPPAVERPMIIPIRAYYMTRADDTLRSVSAQFLNTPSRWQELRSLNAAYPGIADAGPDTLLPAGSALALPGDPLPWGSPDPVYLWTLAEKFLYTAWGREPSPEEVAPFWRGLTSGAGSAIADPAALAATPPEALEPPIPRSMQPLEMPPEAADSPPEVAEEPVEDALPEFVESAVGAVGDAGPEPAGLTTDDAGAVAPQDVAEPGGAEPPQVDAGAEPALDARPPEATAVQAPAVAVDEPAVDLLPEPAIPAVDDAVEFPPEVAQQHVDAPAAPPVAETWLPEDVSKPVVAGVVEEPAVFAPPVPPPVVDAPPAPPVVEEPAVFAPPVPPPVVPPLVEEPAVFVPPALPPVVDAPPLVEEPAVFAPPVPPPAPPLVEEPAVFAPPVPPPVVPVVEEPAVFAPPAPPVVEEPAVFAPPVPPPVPPPVVSPVVEEPAVFAPPAPPPVVPVVDVPPLVEEPAVFAPPVVPPVVEEPAVFAPLAPFGEAPPAYPLPEEPAAVEPGAAHELAHTDEQLPAFMPSVTGAAPSTELPVEEVVASSQRVLAGTAIGDAMLLWQLGRMRRRGSRRGREQPDELELSLAQSARMDSLRLIEAAMRQLRAVTVAQLKPRPRVVCVRTGTYGFEVLLDQPIEAPDGWTSASGGYVLELPRGVTVEQLDAAGRGPSLCPALIPVGNTAEGPLLLNIEEIGCLAVSGPDAVTAGLLGSMVEVLGSSPLAGDIRVITVGVNAPSGPGWERIHATSFDSPQLEHLLSTAHSPADVGAGSVDVLVVGPGNDLLFQRAAQIATTLGSRLVLVGATSFAASRWPWRIYVEENLQAAVHPIAVNIVAAQAMRPEPAHPLSGATGSPDQAPRV